MSVIGMQHTEVVAAIKAGGDETALLLVDEEADDFFQRCNVVPTEHHAPAELKPKASVSSSASSASSTSSLPKATRSSPPAEVEAPPPLAAGGLSLGMTLAQARDRARQKREAKKAPTMDWGKRNELFGNL
ncbi:Na(+)/H(+) exchange regulatory cofactor NHE-RF1 [Liparis tanakae]|uniref:Na(+)/H(+) exchange regulatory cofactor NHE-RF1 n=1 Tax=Liparis tanakae TaxID=230148 RepID=A0A4Z2EFV3_9TELE|nr:Na(+)/H(+) exchange regulatory cofactor NHE-RF1 [Liparis tanakae]